VFLLVAEGGFCDMSVAVMMLIICVADFARSRGKAAMARVRGNEDFDRFFDAGKDCGPC